MLYGPAASYLAENCLATEELKKQSEYKYKSMLIDQPWVLRWSQGRAPWDEEPILFDSGHSQTLLAAAAERKKHLGYLAEIGMQVPQHASFIGCSPFEPGAMVLYDRVRFISGENMVNTEDPTTIKRLGSILGKYYEHCQKSANRLYLSDIFDASQYIISSDGDIHLVDVEAIVLSLDDPNWFAASSRNDAEIFLEHCADGEQW